jgi:hypothetical protein
MRTLAQEEFSVVEEAFGVGGFRLGLAAVHGPEQVGEMDGSAIAMSGTGAPAALAACIRAWKGGF